MPENAPDQSGYIRSKILCVQYGIFFIGMFLFLSLLGLFAVSLSKAIFRFLPFFVAGVGYIVCAVHFRRFLSLAIIMGLVLVSLIALWALGDFRGWAMDKVLVDFVVITPPLVVLLLDWQSSWSKKM